MALGGFNIKYQPQKAIKSQALADFVVDFSPGLEAIDDDDVEHIKAIDKGGTWLLFVDGASNFREAGLGIVLKSSWGDIMA